MYLLLCKLYWTCNIDYFFFSTDLDNAKKQVATMQEQISMLEKSYYSLFSKVQALTSLPEHPSIHPIIDCPPTRAPQQCSTPKSESVPDSANLSPLTLTTPHTLSHTTHQFPTSTPQQFSTPKQGLFLNPPSLYSIAISLKN